MEYGTAAAATVFPRNVTSLVTSLTSSSSLITETPRSKGYGNAVDHGCSLPIMSYMAFAMIGIYTAINVNNNINSNNNNNNNNDNNNNNANMNTNTGGRKRRRRRRDLNSENDIDNIKKFINQPMSELILARQVMAMFFNDISNHFISPKTMNY